MYAKKVLYLFFPAIRPCLILTLLIAFSSLAAAAEDPPVLRLDAKQKSIDLSGYLALLKDPGGQLSIASISSISKQNAFRPLQARSPNLGLSEAVFWLRLRVETAPNPKSRSARWVLKLDRCHLHSCRLYMFFILLRSASIFSSSMTIS